MCPSSFSSNRRHILKMTGVIQLSFDFSYWKKPQNMFSNPSTLPTPWKRYSLLSSDGPDIRTTWIHGAHPAWIWGVQDGIMMEKVKLCFFFLYFLNVLSCLWRCHSPGVRPPDPFFRFLPLTVSSISRLLPTRLTVSYLVRVLVSYTSFLQNILQDLLYVRQESSPGDGPLEHHWMSPLYLSGP